MSNELMALFGIGFVLWIAECLYNQWSVAKQRADIDRDFARITEEAQKRGAQVLRFDHPGGMSRLVCIEPHVAEQDSAEEAAQS